MKSMHVNENVLNDVRWMYGQLSNGFCRDDL